MFTLRGAKSASHVLAQVLDAQRASRLSIVTQAVVEHAPDGQVTIHEPGRGGVGGTAGAVVGGALGLLSGPLASSRSSLRAGCWAASPATSPAAPFPPTSYARSAKRCPRHLSLCPDHRGPRGRGGDRRNEAGLGQRGHDRRRRRAVGHQRPGGGGGSLWPTYHLLRGTPHGNADCLEIRFGGSRRPERARRLHLRNARIRSRISRAMPSSSGPTSRVSRRRSCARCSARRVN